MLCYPIAPVAIPHKLGQVVVPRTQWAQWVTTPKGLLTTTPPAGYKGFVTGTFSIIKPEETLISVSNDGGRTWSAPLDLTATAHPAMPTSAGTGAPSLVVGPNGTAYAFAAESLPPKAKGPNHLVMFKSTNHGTTWSARVVGFSVPSAYKSLSLPQAAVDPNGDRLYLADQVTLGTPGSKGGVSSIYVASSTNGGETWKTPVDVVGPQASSAYDQYDPGISVAPDGRVDVAWQDFRSDPFYELGANGKPVAGSAKAEKYYDIYASYSTDHGASWAPDIRVSSQTINSDLGVEFPDFADGPVGIASTKSHMYVAWGNPAAGTGNPEDSYFNAVDITAPASTTSSGVDNALWGIIGGGSGLLIAGLALLVATTLARRRSRQVRV